VEHPEWRHERRRSHAVGEEIPNFADKHADDSEPPALELGVRHALRIVGVSKTLQVEAQADHQVPDDTCYHPGRVGAVTDARRAPVSRQLVPKPRRSNSE
jgi:hypothetical protein